MENNIKKLLEKDYIIVCDTNVFLHIYRYSPEFSDFALECMQAIKNYIIIPSTVRLEFLKHYQAYFGDMKKRSRKAVREIRTQIDNANRKILSACDNLQAQQYQDSIELRRALERKLAEAAQITEDFMEEHNILEFISNPWNGNNLVLDLFNDLIGNNQCMQAITQEEIYSICDEGAKRYSSTPQIPPGFKDAKGKDGVRKYSDLILWKEIIKYSKANGKNILFITDDVKSDWWVTTNDVTEFHPVLIEEFQKETQHDVIAMTSLQLFADISKFYEINLSDAVEIALRMTDAEYFERVYDDVFDYIISDLSESGENYVKFYNYVGDYGIGEIEIESYEFLSAEMIDRDEDLFTYIFTFKVEASTVSFDYYGKDDDTKQIFTMPVMSHELEGEIKVEVTREADLYLDFEADYGFENAEIVSGELVEVYSEYIPDVPKDAYTVCPDCGNAINHENDGGNGFCVNCAPEH